MTYYHCSPTQGLTVLQPGEPKHFHKPARVYMATLLPMALLYGARLSEYTYGYTKAGQIYLDEYFPHALETFYRGKTASLYVCAPAAAEPTEIPNEVVSAAPVPVLEEIFIPDVLEAILEQERLGALVIHRYGELTDKMREWVRRAEADTIREKQLLQKNDAMAAYYREHYPESWALAAEEAQQH